ncbi:hypothetical protein [Parvibaculum sp.]|uniref:tellurite resistance TerB family protein n=1 Tax=Parvibaculum sp. TaxID=2024848 RepID=UPI00320EFD65
MLEGILSQFTMRQAPVIPTSLPIAVDAPDDQDTLSAADKVGLLDECLLGHTMMIEYVDAKHDASRRRVTVLGFDAGPPVTMRARCHERNAFRCFRMDRITAIIDARTGEVFDRPQTYFEERFNSTFDELFTASLKGEKREGALLRLVSPGLTLLGGLAASDGLLHDDEVEAILRYCDVEMSDAGIQANAREMRGIDEHARRFLVPGEAEFTRACRTLGGRGNLRPLLRALREVMDADGSISADEIAFYQQVEEGLRGMAR